MKPQPLPLGSWVVLAVALPLGLMALLALVGTGFAPGMAPFIPVATLTACGLAAAGALRMDWRPLFLAALVMVAPVGFLLVGTMFPVPLAALVAWLAVAVAWRLRDRRPHPAASA